MKFQLSAGPVLIVNTDDKIYLKVGFCFWHAPPLAKRHQSGVSFPHSPLAYSLFEERVRGTNIPFGGVIYCMAMLGLIKAWIDIPLLKGGLHHASGALAAAAMFRAIGWGIEKCISEVL